PFTATATSAIYALSLHDALPIFLRADLHERPVLPHAHRDWLARRRILADLARLGDLLAGDVLLGLLDLVDERLPELLQRNRPFRSEEHTSELQSRENLVCRLLLE